MCDIMTNRGHLMAITRHGVNRTNMGPLMKCSFEETVEILMDAAIYNETDHMRSVSENIIFGQLVPIGTGSFDVHMDDARAPDTDMNALDQATIVLPSKAKSREEYYSLNTPEQKLLDEEDNLMVETPYEEEGHLDDTFPTTGGTYANIQTPEVTPESPGHAEGGGGAYRSPFSIGRATPGATPYQQYTPRPSDISPFTDMAFSPQSPMYSPADKKEEKTKEDYGELSPTYSPGASAVYSGKSVRSTPHTSPAYSPAYTPMSSKYGAKSVAYTPTSPIRMMCQLVPCLRQDVTYNSLSPGNDLTLTMVHRPSDCGYSLGPA
ncbi:unnamed protein product [Effrenium voratum]|nr:unnamed protein product [Effrenium voratum]